MPYLSLKALPFTPGQEAAGVVDMVGEGVYSVRVGDRVAYSFTIGAYAEYTIVPAEKVVLVPEAIDSRTAAALMTIIIRRSPPAVCYRRSLEHNTSEVRLL